MFTLFSLHKYYNKTFLIVNRYSQQFQNSLILNLLSSGHRRASGIFSFTDMHQHFYLN